MIEPAAVAERDRILVGGGEMGALMRAYDWAATAVGPVEQWPQSLRTAVSIILASGYPMYIAWGPEFVQFYNDAYRPILGSKHPRALGQRTPDCWDELWPMIGPMFRNVLDAGVESSARDLLFLMERHGFVEECYFDFSYSPIRDESGGVGGVLTTCSETTGRVVGDRRLRMLRDLAESVAQATSTSQASTAAAGVLSSNASDVPFGLVYLLDTDRGQALLGGAANLEPGSLACPAAIDLASGDAFGWPAAEVVLSGTPVVVDDVQARFGALPGGSWPESPDKAVVLPIAQSGQERPTGLLIAGVSPRLALDADYRSFLELVAGQVAAAISNARAHEVERTRTEALAELDRAKTTFFSNVSHEFRTPLALLLGPVEDGLADREAPLPERQRERLEIARRNGLRLLKLVNTLLDFSRIEAGRIQAAYQATDLATCTAELASGFRSAVERAGLRFVVDCPPLEQPVYVDREMWEKIVLNLLSNALKFTFDGEVAVTLRSGQAGAELTVRDTGTGIPADQLPRLFERFYRVPGARARTMEGSGIGLALIQELVRLHGGSIDVASTFGRGAAFTVRIPYGTAHLPADRIDGQRRLESTASGSESYVAEAQRWLGSEQLGASNPSPRDGQTSLARIIVADDNADMRQYLSRLLGDRHQVEVAADGQAVLDLARERPPDLVLADVMMPRLDGFGLVQALRSDPATQLIPVVLLSARAGEEARVEGLEAGADDYLVKPFTARELLARVDNNLELSRLRRDAARLEQQARQEAERQWEQIRQLFEQAPAIMCLLSGPEHVLTLANARYLDLVGNRPIVGLPMRAALPEVEGQGFFELLDQVFADGEPFVGREARVLLAAGPAGDLRETFIDFIYAPVRAPGGAVTGVFVHGFEVTDQVRARQRAEELAGQREEALEEARTAIRARDEFLSIASHELRNPVAGIKGSAQLLARLQARDQLDEERLGMFIARILESSERLAALTRDLLDVSRLQTGQLPLDRQPLDLSRLVRNVVAREQSEQHAFVLDLDDDAARVLVDAVRIDQVLTNLLDNAAKYSPAGSEVRIRLQRADGGLRCEVSDAGIGLPENAAEAIFEPFGRASNATGQKGMGLGLYICRKILEQHGGRIWASSAGEQRGTTIGFWLPLHAAAVPAGS